MTESSADCLWLEIADSLDRLSAEWNRIAGSLAEIKALKNRDPGLALAPATADRLMDSFTGESKVSRDTMAELGQVLQVAGQ